MQRGGETEIGRGTTLDGERERVVAFKLFLLLLFRCYCVLSGKSDRLTKTEAFLGIFCSWERSQDVEDKYLGLILLLCSRKVANLSYPTLCTCFEPVGVYVLFFLAKPETQDNVMFMQLYEAHASAASLTSCEP
ncbi:unnamed protein product [Sphagnum balticum]